MPPENLPPDGNPDPRPRRVTCEFCDSSLTAHGEVIQLSARAKEFRRLDERLETATKQIAALEGQVRDKDGEIAQLRQQLAAATQPPAPARRGGIFD